MLSGVSFRRGTWPSLRIQWPRTIPAYRSAVLTRTRLADVLEPALQVVADGQPARIGEAANIDLLKEARELALGVSLRPSDRSEDLTALPRDGSNPAETVSRQELGDRCRM